MGASWDGLIELRHGDTHALIAPELGANCIAFDSDGYQVIERVESPDDLLAGPAQGGCPILFPFPGRVTGGQYQFAGHDYTLPLNAPDGRTHLHGFASGRAWRVARHDDASCVCVLDQSVLTPEEARGYPWPFVLTLRWSIAPGLLRADVRVENTGDSDLPFGLGLHPYFAVAPDAVVRVPATALWPLAENLPAGSPTHTAGPWAWADLPPRSSLLLTGLPRGTIEAAAGASTIRFPGNRFGDVVVYRPPGRASVCIEPWTSIAGAVNLLEPGVPHGLLLLSSGSSWEAWVELGVAGAREASSAV